MTLKRGMLLLFLLVSFAAAAPTDRNGDGQWNEQDAFIAATEALELTSRTISRWALVAGGLVAAVALLAVWQLFAHGRKLNEIDTLRLATEKRFAELSDEILRAKRKAAESDQGVQRIDADLASLRAQVGEHRPADIAGIQRQVLELRALIERLTAETTAVRAAIDEAAGAGRDANSRAEAAQAAVAGVQRLVASLEERLAALETRPEPAADVRLELEPEPEPEPVAAPEPEPPPGEPEVEAEPERDFATEYETARALLEAGDFDGALRAAGRADVAAGEDNHRRAAAWLVAGAAQLGLDSPSEAVAALERAVELEPDARRAIAADPVIIRWISKGDKAAVKFCREVNKFIAPVRLKPPPAGAKKTVVKRGRRDR